MEQVYQAQLSELVRTLLADGVEKDAIEKSIDMVRNGLDLLSPSLQGERIAVHAMTSGRLELAVEVILQTLVQGVNAGFIIYINPEKLAQKLAADTKPMDFEQYKALPDEKLPYHQNIVHVHNAICQILNNPETNRDRYLSYAIPEGHPWKTRFENLNIQIWPILQPIKRSFKGSEEFNIVLQQPVRGSYRLPATQLQH